MEWLEFGNETIWMGIMAGAAAIGVMFVFLFGDVMHN